MNWTIRYLRWELDSFKGKIRINDKGKLLGRRYYDDDTCLHAYCRFDEEIGGEGSPVEILDDGSLYKPDVCGTCQYYNEQVVKFYGRKACGCDDWGRQLFLIRCCYDKELEDKKLNDIYSFSTFKDFYEESIADVVMYHYDGIDNVHDVVFEWRVDDKFVE